MSRSRTLGPAAALAVIAAALPRDRGALHVTYLFDTLGDGAPGGEFVADVDFRVTGPHPALELEPCDIATELIG